ncbi:MAG TPA: alpha/beta fold hydrolase, partial [Microthrixaceae bacterium]|nr:alpha/beta fold hydrolase [Microthrixaceae bacterium]
MGTRVGGVAIALLLLATSCSSENSSNEGQAFTGASKSSDLSWFSCDEVPGGQCATLEVPLDWSDPTGEKIDLALGRIPASGKRTGSVVLNPGGPGASGLSLLRSNPLTTKVTEHFDTVSWDSRGVGMSTPVECGGDVPAMLKLDPDPDSVSEQRELDSAAQKVSAECARTDLDLLGHMSTVDVARDLEAIRVALGSEPLNYVGFSYGTHIGQVYAELHPDKIRTMVLDGVVDPAEGFDDFLLGQARAFESSFDRNATACRKAGPKRCGVKDLKAAYDKVHRQVEKTPMGSGSTLVG